MHQSKLIRLLKNLDKSEFNELGRRIKNPLFNRRESLVHLFNLLKKSYPDFNTNQLKKENVSAILFGENEAKAIKKLEDTIYHFNQLTQDLILEKELKQNKTLQRFTYLTALINRGAIAVFHLEAEKLIKQIKQEKEQLSRSFYLYQILNLMYCYPLEGNALALKNDIIEQLLIHLDDFYFTNKLFYSSEIEARKEVYKEDVRNTLVDEISSEVQHSTNDFSLLLQLIYLANSSDKKSMSDFLSLKNKLFSSLKQLTSAEQIRLITTLINYCGKLYMSKVEGITKEWFLLYKHIVDEKIIFDLNLINQTTFINIIHLACNQNEHNWAQSFIKQSKKYIKDKDLYLLGQSILDYEKKNYEKVILQLHQIDFNNVHRNITCRSLLIKSYYELKDFDILDNQIKAMDIYLRRNITNSADFLEANLTFLTMVKKLAKANFWSLKKQQDLRTEIEKETRIAYQSWLLDKANELFN